MPTSKPPPPDERCRDHQQDQAVARCSSCSRTLCDECFRFRLGEKPACARCAYEASTRRQRRFSLAVAFACFAAGGGFWLVRRFDLWPREGAFVVAGAVAALVVAVLIAASARSDTAPEVTNREPAENESIEWESSGDPYRAGARRILLAASPKVSGRVTALAVGASLIASAVLLPASVRLPRWIETELVLGLWWLIVALTLVVLLYRGFRLRDDYVYFTPWNRPAPHPDGTVAATNKGGSSRSSWTDGLGGCDPGCSGVDAEGCVGAIAIAVVLAVALGAAWVFVELAMPVVFFLMYWLLMRAIGRVANDRRGCEGHAARALGWGALWATVYVLPIALVTWLLHLARR